MQIIDIPHTCGGQTTGVMTVRMNWIVEETTFVYQSDLFAAALAGLPYTIAKGPGFWPQSLDSNCSFIPISCATDATSLIDAPPAAASLALGGSAIAPTEGSGNTRDDSSEGEIPRAAFYQTRTFSAGGNLAESGINLRMGIRAHSSPSIIRDLNGTVLNCEPPL